MSPWESFGERRFFNCPEEVSGGRPQGLPPGHDGSRLGRGAAAGAGQGARDLTAQGMDGDGAHGDGMIDDGLIIWLVVWLPSILFSH